MLATLALVFGGVSVLVWRSYRQAGSRGAYQPEGKLRWTEVPSSEVD